MGTEVKLLGLWVSTFVFRVKAALQLKGVVDYEYIEEDVFVKSPRLLEWNPVHKKVPVLVHDNKVICESLVILEYIDETWQQNYPLLPQDPYKKAIARFWGKFADDLVAKAFTALISKGEEKEKAEKELIEGLEKIEGAIKENSSLFAAEEESIGYLDLTMSWIGYWLPVWEEAGSMKIIDPQKLPAITEWTFKFVNHPVIKENLPSRDRMLPYFRKFSEDFFSLFQAPPKN